ncbi:ABC transporter permease [Pseudaminobacter sp. 19-2017]|uniref:ABC transporter permease n=1 Tax=Pseudaminobacter soli (ex Zhang et al. 2022) TaxID=2831468 RepID=A0A942IAW9_9HYPH|nr:ABC transporter permease [Pseudaminobacter soli]MBS3651725.1 ABC transporter permease [Pseudaminobacter soli]
MRPFAAGASAYQRLPRIYWALVGLALVGIFAAPQFRTLSNLANILEQSGTLAVLALGQAFVIAGGMIDLSVGQLVGLITVVACMMFEAYPGMGFLVVVACLGLAALVGLVNGELINRLRMSPLILTFGMLSVLQGFIFMLTDRSIGEAAPFIAFLSNGRVGGIPVSLVLVALVAIGTYYALQRSIFGWHLLAMGNSAESARKAGLNLFSLTRIVFLVSGLCAGVAGLLVAGRLGTGFPNAGNGLELDAIVAVVLGGTPLKGGRVSVLGILGAVLFLGVLNNLLNLLQVPAFTQIVVKGVIVIIAILADRPGKLAQPA